MEKDNKQQDLSNKIPKKRNRKTQEKDFNYEEEEEKKKFERERQKEYSRANRLRKKEYYKKLEEKVHFLQLEVKRLNIELSKEKAKNKSSEFNNNLMTTEMIDTEMIMGEKMKSTEVESLKDIYLEEIKEMAEKILPKKEGRLNQLEGHFDSALKSLF